MKRIKDHNEGRSKRKMRKRDDQKTGNIKMSGDPS
uniref:GIY-YIG domain-containing protein n=1 Tax=Ascaris lumbricoides TaxID=6252 RepID=A0A0M3HVG4_ASCLU